MTPRAPAALMLNRRAGLIGLAVSLAAVRAFAGGQAMVVTMLGDSITAGYGLAAADALPAQLQLALARLGVKAAVRASGVSGDTTADGLARVDFSVQSDTSLCLVALGANDLLQGVDPSVTRANLTGILGRLKARRIPVLLAGISAPPSIGAGYAHDYNSIFPGVAHTQHVPLYPDLLAGAAGNRSLTQADGVHPNPAGVKIIAARLAPAVAKALAAAARAPKP
jgi:acyl-CoA thioesterase-1